MIPTDSLINDVHEMYDPKKVTVIEGQFDDAQKSMGVQTIMREKFEECLVLPHAPTGWYLEITEVDEPTRCVMLDIGEHLIGRSEKCNITLHHRCASRMHCLVTVHTDHITIRDLISSNHVMINGETITSNKGYVLNENDIILASQPCKMTLRKMAR